ncbi:cellulosome enzyme [Plectosphaerella plurivora]|uniref:Cellulosome enzyme n=1 Tax=Plectosphaerella plurivora TaxID=936078 RepID=A0A9P8V8D8_9PEZI|nr:cellulosome enzyme [Plectosphaerella plurivora]
MQSDPSTVSLKKVLAFVASFSSSVLAQSGVTVNVGTKFQTIEGFGVSQAFGRAKEIQNAPAALQKQGLDYLFSTTTGAGFTIIRNRIGSGGNGDSILPTSPGSPNGTPSYKWNNDDSGQVWFSKQAMSYGVKTIYADAWSAPGFMKTSGNEATPGFLCGTTGHTCPSGDWRQAYANFLSQYIKLYSQAGIPVTHVGFLNEPDYKPSYSQMQISTNAQEANSFIPTLYNTLRANGQSNIKIACCDAVGWPMAETHTKAMVAAGMEQYLGIVTGHTYSGDANKALSTKLPVWVTEGAPLSIPFTTTWYSNGGEAEGMTWANKLAVGFVNSNLSAFVYWQGFQIRQTQSSSHLVDSSDGVKATPSGIFWAFAMWSRHIRPGARRLGTAGSVANTITGAFQNTDGSIVVVFTNSGAAAQSSKVAFNGFTAGAASAWVTDASRKFASLASTVSAGAVTVSIPARSVVTVKLTGTAAAKLRPRRP